MVFLPSRASSALVAGFSLSLLGTCLVASTGCSKLAQHVATTLKDEGAKAEGVSPDGGATEGNAGLSGAGNGAANVAVNVALAATPPTTDLVTVTDPVEKAYSMGMPKGWQNRTYSARVGEVHSTVTTTVSPNGSVLLYDGDPNIPQYWSPAAATPITHTMAKMNPRMKIQPFVRATAYFPDYVEKKFGKLPGFAMVSTEADPAAEEKMRAKFASVGAKMQPTVAKIAFTYVDGGRPMRAVVIGSTVDSGAFWMAHTSGVATSGEPEAYLEMLNAMARTFQENPQWRAEQNRKHQQQMAQIDAFGRQMTAQHNQNMAAIQASAQRHQQRMQAIWSANDASMKSYQDRMASSDAQHRGFLNYINDENTVVAGGKSYQVDNSYQRYFVNKTNGTYVGGDITMDADKLRGMGLNPDDYSEAQIKR